jgi:hypothetical protein
MVGATMLGLVFALLVGCSGSSGRDTGGASSGSPSAAASGGPAGPSTTSSASPTSAPSSSVTVDPAAAEEADVTAAVRGYEKALEKALFTRTIKGTDLVRYTTAGWLAHNRSRVQTMRRSGIIYKGTSRNWFGPASVAGNRATSRLCERDDASWYVYVSSGRIAGTKLDRWNGFQVHLLHRDARWQVDRVTLSKKTSCKEATF